MNDRDGEILVCAYLPDCDSGVTKNTLLMSTLATRYKASGKVAECTAYSVHSYTIVQLCYSVQKTGRMNILYSVRL